MIVKMQRFFVLLIFMGLCNGVSKATECTTQGRYPNDDAEHCRGFTMCLIGGVTNFTQYKLTCPVGFVYSHLEQQCTNATRYKCWDSYNCTKVGNFVNSDSESCSSYVACVEGINRIVTARLIYCPENTIFNPNIQLCVNETEYSCYNKRIDVLELASLDNNLYELSANVTMNSADCLCTKYSTLFSLLIFNYSLL